MLHCTAPHLHTPFLPPVQCGTFPLDLGLPSAAPRTTLPHTFHPTLPFPATAPPHTAWHYLHAHTPHLPKTQDHIHVLWFAMARAFHSRTAATAHHFFARWSFSRMPPASVLAVHFPTRATTACTPPARFAAFTRAPAAPWFASGLLPSASLSLSALRGTPTGSTTTWFTDRQHVPWTGLDIVRQQALPAAQAGCARSLLPLLNASFTPPDCPPRTVCCRAYTATPLH